MLKNPTVGHRIFRPAEFKQVASNRLSSSRLPASCKDKLVIAQCPARFIYTQPHLESPASTEFPTFSGLGELIWPSPKPTYPIPHYRHSSLFLVFPLSLQRILVAPHIPDRA